MFEISSDLANVSLATNQLLTKLQTLGLTEQYLQDIRLSFEEALINAIKHGNKFNKDLKVEWDFNIENNLIIIRVKDQGRGYDYKRLPNPILDKNLRKIGGRGVFLIKKLMDKVSFNDSGNEIIMEKFIRR